MNGIEKKEINGKFYQVFEGTYYNAETPEDVIVCLSNLLLSKRRVRLFYGDDVRCWNEENDVIGTIGRSTGTVKIPLLIHSISSSGGPAILDNRIVRIDERYSRKFVRTIYRRDGVSFDHFSFGPSDMSEYHTNVTNDTTGEIYARCKTYRAGVAFAGFMNGKRWSK